MERDIVSLSGEAGTCGLNQVRSFAKALEFIICQRSCIFYMSIVSSSFTSMFITFVECFLLPSTSQPIGISKV